MLLAWVTTPGQSDEVLRNLHRLEQVIFVLVARIGAFERYRAGVDRQHIFDDLRQRRFIQARAFVDAVAGVEAHLLARDALQRGVDRLDIDLRAALHLLVVEAGLDEDVGQERIVDLHE